jgi:hypothetical protein
LVIVAALTLAAGGSAATAPQPLRGVPLPGDTGLRLLVASNPPYVLDVDSGRRTRVAGIAKAREAVLWVRPAGTQALVVLDRNRPGRKAPSAEVFVLREGATAGKLLGRGWGVAPSSDGESVWISAQVRAGRCRLQEVRLDGTRRGPGRPFPCGLLDPGGSLGLIVHRTARDELVDPLTGRTVMHAPQILAVADARVITQDRAKRLTLIDTATGTRTRLPWPSAIGGEGSQGGTDEAAVDPSGTLVALGFSDPAYQLGDTQVTDLWLLDTVSGAFRQLPDMPAVVSLKRTSWAWTGDGRLVTLAESEGATLVGVWKPGDERIAVRRVRLPERNSGSDSFVVR